MNRLEDHSIHFEGRTHITDFKNALLNLFSFGMLAVVCRLSTSMAIFLKTVPCALGRANCAILRDQYGNQQLLPITHLRVKRTLTLKRYTKNATVQILNSPYGRFVYDHLLDKFVLPTFTRPTRPFEELLKQQLSLGKETEQVNLHERQVLYGRNVTGLVVHGPLEIVLRHVVEPFFIWELLSFATWIAIRYFKYAYVVGSIYLGMLVANIAEDLRKEREVRRNMRPGTVRVLREGTSVPVPEIDVLPGDLLFIDRCESVCCDVEILKGNVIADESFLTGESVPICKGPGSTVLSGTKVVKSASQKVKITDPHMERLVRINSLTKARASPRREKAKERDGVEDSAVGIVVRTGKRTRRSALLMNLSIRKPVTNEFTRQSQRVIKCLIAGALALMGLFVLYFLGSLPFSTNLEYSSDVALTFFSPALYTCLQLGALHACRELLRRGINTTDSSRINTAGEVDLIVFDKTGTLTELGVDIQCYDTIDAVHTQIEGVGLQSRQALSTCHYVVELDDQYSGDVLDMKMFLFSHSKIVTREGRRFIEMDIQGNYRPAYKEYSTPGEECTLVFDAEGVPAELCQEDTLEVLKIHDFDLFLKRLSVVTRDHRGQTALFCKGAPDSVARILRQIPEGYHERVRDYGLAGHRVLAVAWRPIDEFGARERDEAELEFLGLLVFANRLKAETTAVVQELRTAGLNPKMCTGDGILTAISVARECGMINPGMPILFPVLEDGCRSCYDVEWYSVAEEDFVFDRFKMVLHTELDTEIFYDFVVACESREFAYFRGTCYERLILDRGVVFARFNPDNKKDLVDNYASAGFVTMFCGDGANDTGALASADVGLSLATKEASLAASFNSRSLAAVLDVVKEGRSALAMSAAQFRYVFYSQALAGLQIVALFPFGLFPADGMSLLNDLLSCYVLGYALSNFRAAGTISPRKFPCRVTSDCITILGELACVLLVYLGAGLFLGEPGVAGAISPVSKRSTVVYFSTLLLLIAKAFAFADFGEYRARWLETPVFMGIVGACLALFLFVLGAFLKRVKFVMDFFWFVRLDQRELAVLFSCMALSLLVTFFPFRVFACRFRE